MCQMNVEVKADYRQPAIFAKVLFTLFTLIIIVKECVNTGLHLSMFKGGPLL